MTGLYWFVSFLKLVENVTRIRTLASFFYNKTLSYAKENFDLLITTKNFERMVAFEFLMNAIKQRNSKKSLE